MQNPYSSLQAQSPLADAQQSVGKVHRAVKQAQSHPSDETVENAYNAINKAENALSQAAGSLNQEPLQRAYEDLQQDQADLEQVEDLLN
ncbi:hypothetical protein EJP82_14940 [Paenibacillus anaericanus]|uniref:DUF3813 domain-containing protein n=1 Tax=Paenibacillus anaericanus TaxID=170367 RepID=A0A3S1DII3_9BACL|nr:hypothetical protein [Paenibacillus anaericanus]RUT45584.1 hypothetical protein EJP82_14940 [Paenibacillus anaericanus]